jgi:hypothetical protein
MSLIMLLSLPGFLRNEQVAGVQAAGKTGSAVRLKTSLGRCPSHIPSRAAASSMRCNLAEAASGSIDSLFGRSLGTAESPTILAEFESDGHLLPLSLIST